MVKSLQSRWPSWSWTLLVILIVIPVVAGAYAYYHHESERIRDEEYRGLAAIGNLKAHQIEQWRQERLGDVPA